MIAGLRSRRKGSRAELEVVKLLQDYGLSAEKIPLSGACGGSFAGDVSVPVLNQDCRVEVKRRARSYGTTYKHLGSNYALIKRDDQCEWLVTMRLKDWAALALGKSSGPTPASALAPSGNGGSGSNQSASSSGDSSSSGSASGNASSGDASGTTAASGSNDSSAGGSGTTANGGNSSTGGSTTTASNGGSGPQSTFSGSPAAGATPQPTWTAAHA